MPVRRQPLNLGGPFFVIPYFRRLHQLLRLDSCGGSKKNLPRLIYYYFEVGDIPFINHNNNILE
jgi:hypothetical protein